MTDRKTRVNRLPRRSSRCLFQARAVRRTPLKIPVGALAENAVEHRVIAVIAGAHDPARLARVRGDPVDDFGLTRGKIGQVAAHVVEQDGSFAHADIIEKRELCRQCGTGFGVEIG